MIDCPHWSMIDDEPNCAIEAYGHPNPSRNTCNFCLAHGQGVTAVRMTVSVKKPSGLGTTFKKAIHWSLDRLERAIRPRARYRLGWIERVKRCGGCRWREDFINKTVPYDADIWTRRLAWLRRLLDTWGSRQRTS